MSKLDEYEADATVPMTVLLWEQDANPAAPFMCGCVWFFLGAAVGGMRAPGRRPGEVIDSESGDCQRWSNLAA